MALVRRSDDRLAGFGGLAGSGWLSGSHWLAGWLCLVLAVALASWLGRHWLIAAASRLEHMSVRFARPPLASPPLPLSSSYFLSLGHRSL